MRSSTRFVPFTLAVALVPLLFGCAGSVSRSGQKPTPAAGQVAVSIAEDFVTLGAGESYQFTASVTGSLNTAVTWSLSGCADAGCGTISPTGLYLAPSTIPVGVTARVAATSQADSTKSDSVEVHQMPIVVSIAPVAAWVGPGKTVGFTASVRYDANNAGVGWSLLPACTDSSCGTLASVSNTSVSYIAPANIPNPSTVMLTAASITDPSKTADVTITVSSAVGLSEGDYAFSFDGWGIRYTDPQRQYYTFSGVATAGHFYVDANGNITAGVEDVNLDSGILQSVPFTGNYSLGSDRRGNFSISTAQGTSTYQMTVDASGTRGRFIKSDGLPGDGPIFGSGFFEKQDKSAFSLSNLAGPYAMSLLGTVNGPNRTAALGAFTLDPGGTFSDGQIDRTVQVFVGVAPQSNSTGPLTGSFSAPSPTTGRGTATMTASSTATPAGSTLNFAYYVVSAGKILMVQTDSGNSTVPRLSGELRRQNGPFSASLLDEGVIFGMVGANRKEYAPPVVDAMVGQFVLDGVGSLNGVLDDNQGASNKGFTGTYTVAANGRTTIKLVLDPASPHTVMAYLYGPNEGFLMDTSGTDVRTGQFRPQLGGPFTTASVSGALLTSTTRPPSQHTENATGLTVFDGAGGLTSTLDAIHWTDLNHYDLQGTYTLSSNGRGTLTFNAPTSGRPIVFWVISPTELLGVSALHADAASADAPIFAASLLQFEK